MLARPPLGGQRKGICRGRALQSKWMFGAENDKESDTKNERVQEKLKQGAQPLAERRPNQGVVCAKPLSFAAPRMRPVSADVITHGRMQQAGSLDGAGGAERPGSRGARHPPLPRLEFRRSAMEIMGDVVVLIPVPSTLNPSLHTLCSPNPKP